MVRGKKTRRATTLHSPRGSPTDKDSKRIRSTRTLDGFLALASDNDEDMMDPESNPPQAAPTIEEPQTSEGQTDGTKVHALLDLPSFNDEDNASQTSTDTLQMGNDSKRKSSNPPSSVSTVSTLDTTVATDDRATVDRPEPFTETCAATMTDTSPGVTHATQNNHRSALIPLRPFVQRWTLRIRVAPSTSAEKEIHDGLRRILTQFKSVDPSFLLYRWADDDSTAANISIPMLLPPSIGRLRHYFPRLTPRDKGGDVYTSIRFGTSIANDAFRDAINPWLQQHRHGLWPCAVQAESTTCLGWLLYSSRDIDLAVLKAALERQTGHEIGLRWRPIAVGRATPENEKIRAIHIEVNTKLVEEIKPTIRQIYSSSSTSWPNGVRMRLVPELGVHMSTDLRSKIARLRQRQSQFTSKVIRIQNWEIAAMDFRSNAQALTLREMFMSLRAKDRPTLQLFHSVDQQWNGSGHTFTVLPILEAEARTVIAGLLPFLRANFPEAQEHLDRHFTAAAVERADSCRWDISSHTLITEDDAMIENVLDDFDEFTLESNAVQLLAPSATTINPGDHNPNLLGGDTDSVSTLHSYKEARAAPEGNHRHIPATSNLGTTTTSPQASTISSITVEERVQSLELKVENSLKFIMEELRCIRNEKCASMDSTARHQESMALETDLPPEVGPSL